MDAFLLCTAEDRRILCEHTAAQRNLPAPVIEKDFWICWMLRELFRLPGWEGHLTFKGGTSLSKGWGLINRFSEDLDVVISRAFLGYAEATMSNSRWKKLRDACRPHVQEVLRPALTERLRERLDGLPWNLLPADQTEDHTQVTLLFHYPTVFTERDAYVRPVVKLEFGCRTDTEPVVTPEITSFLAETMPELFTEHTVVVRTVAPRRTFWEKAMLLLHEEKLRPAAEPRKARLARHYYDLFCLITRGIAREAMDDAGLFECVAAHRKTVYKLSWVEYDMLCRGSLDMIPSVEQLPDWRADYNAMRGQMFLGDPPPFDEILRYVRQFQDEFNRIQEVKES